MKNLTFIDLFSGIGGFRYPIEGLGHKCIGYSEIDKYALKTYRSNYLTQGELCLGNISNIKPDIIPNFNLLVGGFPCQPFSINGRRKGFKDIRGTLFFYIAQILEKKHPEYFILENVKGLVNHNKGNETKCGYKSIGNVKYDGKKQGIGKTLKVIEDTLSLCGYTFFWDILNTKDYGLPQNRERIIIVGQRKDLGKFNFTFPPKEKLSLCVKDFLDDEVDKKYYLSEKLQSNILNKINVSNFILNTNSIIDDRQSDLRIYDGVSPTVRAARQGLYVVNSPIFLCGINPPRKGYESQSHLSRAYRPKDRLYDANGIAPTICSGEQSGRYNFMLYKNDNLILRKLTAKECLRLQGFSDTLFMNAKIAGVSESQLYKQAGNAVSITVIKKVMLQLQKCI